MENQPSIQELLNELNEQLKDALELVNSSQTMPFSSKIIIEGKLLEEVLLNLAETVHDIVETIPQEIKLAKQIISQADKIFEDAVKKAHNITNMHTTTNLFPDIESLIIAQDTPPEPIETEIISIWNNKGNV